MVTAQAQDRRTRQSDLVVAALVVAAALGGALAGTHATGTPVVDPVYAALVAGLVTLAASRASREMHLNLAVLAAALSRDGCWYRVWARWPSRSGRSGPSVGGGGWGP